MRRRVIFEPQAFVDLRQLQGRIVPFSEDLHLVVTQQISFIDQFGTSGSEAVVYESEEAWSRDLLGKHRLIFQINDEEIRILSCRHRRK